MAQARKHSRNFAVRLARFCPFSPAVGEGDTSGEWGSQAGTWAGLGFAMKWMSP